jgi:hypothetical protein
MRRRFMGGFVSWSNMEMRDSIRQNRRIIPIAILDLKDSRFVAVDVGIDGADHGAEDRRNTPLRVGP